MHPTSKIYQSNARNDGTIQNQKQSKMRTPQQRTPVKPQQNRFLSSLTSYQTMANNSMPTYPTSNISSASKIHSTIQPTPRNKPEVLPVEGNDATTTRSSKTPKNCSVKPLSGLTPAKQAYQKRASSMVEVKECDESSRFPLTVTSVGNDTSVTSKKPATTMLANPFMTLANDSAVTSSLFTNKSTPLTKRTTALPRKNGTNTRNTSSDTRPTFRSSSTFAPKSTKNTATINRSNNPTLAPSFSRPKPTSSAVSPFFSLSSTFEKGVVNPTANQKFSRIAT